MGKRNRNKDLKSGEFFSQVVRHVGHDKYSLSELVQPKPGCFPHHSHESAYFCLLLEGAYCEYFRSRAYCYGVNTIVWHPPAIDHSDAVGRDGARFFTVEIKTPMLDKLREFSKVPADIILSKGGMSWLGMRLFDEFRLADAASPLAIEGLLLEMLATATREKGIFQRRRPRWVERTRERLAEEFANAPTIEELAAEAGVHPAHLSSVFRKTYGNTPGAFIRERRLSKARELLLRRDIPLAEIALRLGYSDQSHFTRDFKKINGIPPGSFRRRATQRLKTDKEGLMIED